MITLGEFLRDNVEALTYINALKVTMIELKEELSQQSEQLQYLNASRDRANKLMRKADNQYRLIAKLARKEAPLASNVTIQDDTKNFNAMQELMEEL